jgi:hypothetical protein
MARYSTQNISQLNRYCSDLFNSPHKWKQEIFLEDVAKAMIPVGFEGPVNKSGAVRSFTHELLAQSPRLTGGEFTVHVDQKSRITFYDFKKFVFPYIEEVCAIIDEQGLIEQENDNA